MKFGKEFKTHLEETLPEWRDKFLCYKPLKKLLKQFPPTSDGSPNLFPPPPASADHPRPESGTDSSLVLLQEWFIRILNEELDKFNDFFVDKEEDFIIRFQVLFCNHYFICWLTWLHIVLYICFAYVGFWFSYIYLLVNSIYSNFDVK